jgi:RNA polymerase sigma-70 factor (ECF subfamily)
VDLIQATDEELMLAYQNGQEKAFQTLYQRHHRRVYGFLIGKLKTPQQADEAFQMTFLKLHQSRQHYDPSFPFLPWLFTLCRNTLIDFVRSQNRISKQEELDPVAVDSAFTSPEAPLNTPSLQSLSPKHREAIELRYLEDLPFEEIAKRLGTTPLNARQVVSRATRTLKKWFSTNPRGDL